MSAAPVDEMLIEDVETMRLLAHPLRLEIVETLTERRTVTELAEAMEVPRTRLYHHVNAMERAGLIRVVDSRRAGALTEKVYQVSAWCYRPAPALLEATSPEQLAEALLTVVFDTTRADLARSLDSGLASLDRTEPRTVGVGRGLTYLTDEEAHDFIEELEMLMERFSRRERSEGAGTWAFTFAFYPTSRRLT